MKLYSVFLSVDGEVNGFNQGAVTTFIRLAGCNLRCNYCDTEYALEESSGYEIPVDKVVAAVEKIGCKKVTITGGEPLRQTEELLILVRALASKKYTITIETNGTYPIYRFKETRGPLGRVFWVLDYKLDQINEPGDLDLVFANMRQLTENDFIKFVVKDVGELKIVKNVMGVLRAAGAFCRFAVSPVFDKYSFEALLQDIKNEKMFDLVLNVPLHKVVNLNESK